MAWREPHAPLGFLSVTLTFPCLVVLTAVGSLPKQLAESFKWRITPACGKGLSYLLCAGACSHPTTAGDGVWGPGCVSEAREEPIEILSEVVSIGQA